MGCFKTDIRRYKMWTASLSLGLQQWNTIMFDAGGGESCPTCQSRISQRTGLRSADSEGSLWLMILIKSFSDPSSPDVILRGNKVTTQLPVQEFSYSHLYTSIMVIKCAPQFPTVFPGLVMCWIILRIFTSTRLLLVECFVCLMMIWTTWNYIFSECELFSLFLDCF